MKKKKLPIFLELTIGSLVIIISILAIYTVMQLSILLSFSNDYEKDYLISKYNEINSLSQNINSQISETGFYEFLEDTISEGEYLRIYSPKNTYYEDQSKVWNNINFNHEYNSVDVDFKLIDFDIYKLLSGPTTINGNQYTIQMIKEVDIFEEFMESYFPTLIFILLLGIILSIIGAMYVSKNFIKRLKSLTATMNEIKEKGITKRAEISELNDEIDKVNIIFNSMMDEVQEAFDEQGRFVSDASHELKTPLTALQGHLKMLKRWGKNDKERLDKSLDICLNEVERLKKIVNDMLVLSNVEKSSIDLEKIEEINPNTIVESVIEEYKILNQNVRYIVNLEDNIKMKIDPHDLKQLLIIFIDNSIKYNDKEIIEIEITLKRINEKVHLSIKDNGIGIPQDEINNVIKRFYKVDKSRVNNNSFGIGLSIANRIINNYQGEFEIRSELNEYTQIIICI